jgi:SAM-dependent methyltransferase
MVEKGAAMTSTSPPALPAPLRMSQLILSLWIPQAIHAAAELGVADALSRGPSTSHEVAQVLGTHADATDRLLRALRTLGVVSESEGRFELTELGRCLETTSPTSRRAWCRLMGSPPVWGAWGRLVDCVRTGQRAWGSGQGAAGGADPFETMAQDQELAGVFHHAMLELTSGVAPGIVAAVDWSGVRRVVDVGGGHGALLAAILEANPHLEGAVFDLEHARPGALDLLVSGGRLGRRATFVSGDVFTTAPPAADAIVLKSVIHDWDDERSLAILSRCREALNPGGRLLLVESPAAPGGGGNPLQDWFLTFSDLNMLVNTGGRERTEAEYRALLERAGLRVLAVRETPSFFRVFEATSPTSA